MRVRLFLAFVLFLPLISVGQEESVPPPPDASFKKTSSSVAPAQELTSLVVVDTAQGAEVEVFGDGSLEYSYYTLASPARLVIDFKGVSSQLKSKLLQNPFLSAIRCYELRSNVPAKEVARVVVELKAHMKFEVRVQESGLKLNLTSVEPVQSSSAPPTTVSTSGPVGSSPLTVESQTKVQPPPTIEQKQKSEEQPAPLTSSTSQTEQISPPASPTKTSSPPAVSSAQKKAVVFLPTGPLDLEPSNADPALFFTVPTNSTDYVLGPEDVIEVRVLQMNELNVTVRIAGDGAITLPFLGSVAVSGLTATDVSEKIGRLLGEQFLKNPQVSVFVKEFNSQKISIIGSVQTPGTYPLTGPRTIIQMLAQAGGVRPDAGRSILVFRQDLKGQSTRLAIQRENLLVKGDPAWNIWLYAGDVVNIPPQEQISISLFGAVASPGVYTLASGSESTLLKAIAKAGGLQRASKSGVRIQRKNASGKETVLEVNLNDILSGKKPDIPLQDGDLVIINESFF